MYITRIPNRSSPPAVLLRESYREDGKVKSRTLANLSHLPDPQIELMRRVLKGEALVAPEEAFEIVRSRPHGHVAAVLGTLRRLGLHTWLSRTPTRVRRVVEAMIVARILDPRSKLATARGLGSETQFSSLGERLELHDLEIDELYEAMDWLLTRQSRVEKALAKRHLQDGTLVLYDLTSSYFEGRTCPLAKRGHSRDRKKGTLQIVFGLLCSPDGCPIAVEVFEGNTGDPKTVASQVDKLRKRFGLTRLVMVGDRGMLTEARLREDVRPIEGLSWISALRNPAIRQLVHRGSLQLSLFDEKDLAEIEDPEFPGERLIVCRNPLLANERARKREDLLQATEKELDKIVTATTRLKRTFRGKDKIGIRVGKVIDKYKMAKHFDLTITEDRFHYQRKVENIENEAALDGIYVIRTDVPRDTLSAEDAVRSYKGLSVVERAFRSFKSVDLKVRPIHHRLADRVRAHVFLCMLAYYVEWHMRRALAPILFDDNDKASAEALRKSVVQPAQRSAKALKKARTKRTEDDLPVHSFQTLLQDLATLVIDRVQPKPDGLPAFDKLTTPTPVQQRALDLLGVTLDV
ncbi:MAG: IS1634 family transposase [Planctomycetes bacterium]|nr:IS1634 family transposase [Planctomycetota bacterium]